MIEGKDYKFRDDLVPTYENNVDTVPIEILIPKYAGVVYRYLHVGITEDVENKSAILKFSFDIVKTPDIWKDNDFKHDPVFTQIAGTILNALLLDLNNDSNNRTDNPTKSDNE